MSQKILFHCIFSRRNKNRWVKKTCNPDFGKIGTKGQVAARASTPPPSLPAAVGGQPPPLVRTRVEDWTGSQRVFIRNPPKPRPKWKPLSLLIPPRGKQKLPQTRKKRGEVLTKLVNVLNRSPPPRDLNQRA